MAFTGRDGRTQTVLAEINMVPFIDIVLVLLIIFMIATPVIQSGIEVDVPKTETVREVRDSRLVVTIDREQRVYLQNEPVRVDDLGSTIRARSEGAPPRDGIYLRADAAVPFGTVAVVMDRLRMSGIENISIVTQPATERRRR